MEGVKIIETIVENGMPVSSVLCVAFACLFVAFVAISDMLSTWKTKHHGYALGMVSVVVISILTIGLAWHDNTSKRVSYIVTVDNSVNFNEFINKYEIVARNGEKYTVRLLPSASE